MVKAHKYIHRNYTKYVVLLAHVFGIDSETEI